MYGKIFVPGFEFAFVFKELSSSAVFEVKKKTVSTSKLTWTRCAHNH